MRTRGLAKWVVLRKVLLCAALALLWGVLRAGAAEPYECHVEAFSANRLLVTIEINDYNVRSIQGVDGKVWSAFHVVGAPNVLEKGSPALPYVAKVLPVPYAEATVRVLDANYEELSVAPPLPSRGPVVAGSVEARAPRVEGAAYRDTAVWPREVSVLRAVAGSAGELRLLVYPLGTARSEARCCWRAGCRWRCCCHLWGLNLFTDGGDGKRGEAQQTDDAGAMRGAGVCS